LTEAMIRRMTAGDIGTVTGIYNEAIITTTATFYTDPKSLKDRKKWFLEHGPKHPILVSDVGHKFAKYHDVIYMQRYSTPALRVKGIS